MAKIDTLYTPFDGSSLGAEWQLTTTNPTSATESGGNLVIESLSGSVAAGVETVDTFDFTNSAIVIEAAASQPGEIRVIAVAVGGSGLSPAIRFDNGTSRPLAGFSTGTSYGNYVVGTNGRRFVRLSHDGTNVVWETSADGVSYTTLHTQAASTFGALTNSRLRIVTVNGSVTSFSIATIGSPPAGPSPAALARYRRHHLLMEP